MATSSSCEEVVASAVLPKGGSETTETFGAKVDASACNVIRSREQLIDELQARLTQFQHISRSQRTSQWQGLAQGLAQELSEAALAKFVNLIELLTGEVSELVSRPHTQSLSGDTCAAHQAQARKDSVVSNSPPRAKYAGGSSVLLAEVPDNWLFAFGGVTLSAPRGKFDMYIVDGLPETNSRPAVVFANKTTTVALPLCAVSTYLHLREPGDGAEGAVLVWILAPGHELQIGRTSHPILIMRVSDARSWNHIPISSYPGDTNPATLRHLFLSWLEDNFGYHLHPDLVKKFVQFGLGEASQQVVMTPLEEATLVSLAKLFEQVMSSIKRGLPVHESQLESKANDDWKQRWELLDKFMRDSSSMAEFADLLFNSVGAAQVCRPSEQPLIPGLPGYSGLATTEKSNPNIFQSVGQTFSIPCYFKANDGHLFPLKVGIFYLATSGSRLVRVADIEDVKFGRGSISDNVSQMSGRSFDIQIKLKLPVKENEENGRVSKRAAPGSMLEFCMLDREHLQSLSGYAQKLLKYRERLVSDPNAHLLNGIGAKRQSSDSDSMESGNKMVKLDTTEKSREGSTTNPTGPQVHAQPVIRDESAEEDGEEDEIDEEEFEDEDEDDFGDVEEDWDENGDEDTDEDDEDNEILMSARLEAKRAAEEKLMKERAGRRSARLRGRTDTSISSQRGLSSDGGFGTTVEIEGNKDWSSDDDDSDFQAEDESEFDSAEYDSSEESEDEQTEDVAQETKQSSPRKPAHKVSKPSNNETAPEYKSPSSLKHSEDTARIASQVEVQLQPKPVATGELKPGAPKRGPQSTKPGAPIPRPGQAMAHPAFRHFMVQKKL